MNDRWWWCWSPDGCAKVGLRLVRVDPWHEQGELLSFRLLSTKTFLVIVNGDILHSIIIFFVNSWTRWYYICIQSQRGLKIWHMAHWIVLTGASYPSLTSQGKTSATVTKAEKKYLTTRRATLRPTMTPRRRSMVAARPQGGCIATAAGSNSDRSQLRWRRRNEQQEAGREAPTNHTLRDKEDQGLGVFEAWWVLQRNLSNLMAGLPVPALWTVAIALISPHTSQMGKTQRKKAFIGWKLLSLHTIIISHIFVLYFLHKGIHRFRKYS